MWPKACVPRKLTRFDQIWPDLIRFDQIWSDLIRFDQIWPGLIRCSKVSSRFDSLAKHYQMVVIQILSEVRAFHTLAHSWEGLFIRFDQIWSDLVRFDQIWSDLTSWSNLVKSDQIWSKQIEWNMRKCLKYDKRWWNPDKYDLIRIDQIWLELIRWSKRGEMWPNLVKSDQIWSSLLKSDQIWSNLVNFRRYTHFWAHFWGPKNIPFLSV